MRPCSATNTPYSSRCWIDLVDSSRTRSALHLSTVKIVFLMTIFLTQVFDTKLITQEKSQKRETPQGQRSMLVLRCSATATSLVPYSPSCKSQDWRLKCVNMVGSVQEGTEVFTSQWSERKLNSADGKVLLDCLKDRTIPSRLIEVVGQIQFHEITARRQHSPRIIPN